MEESLQSVPFLFPYSNTKTVICHITENKKLHFTQKCVSRNTLLYGSVGILIHLSSVRSWWFDWVLIGSVSNLIYLIFLLKLHFFWRYFHALLLSILKRAFQFFSELCISAGISSVLLTLPISHVSGQMSCVWGELCLHYFLFNCFFSIQWMPWSSDSFPSLLGDFLS